MIQKLAHLCLISIHALLAESDLWVLRKVPILGIFLSTLSLRRATFRQNYECFEWIISIHALLAESDGWTLNINGPMKISIHALLAESDRAPQPPQGESSIFLSTLSLRRATCRNGQNVKSRHISIHALLAESDVKNASTYLNIFISIHALLAESDVSALLVNGGVPSFLSTLSLRRATRNSQNIKRRHNISIHALLAESDRAPSITPAPSRRNFYPRSPCGERQFSRRLTHHQSEFLSTLSLRRATTNFSGGAG